MSPAVRISIGVAAMSVCLVLLADTLLGIFPNPVDDVLKQREKLSESLGMQYASFVSEAERLQVLPLMESTVLQNEDLLSLGLRSVFGQMLVDTAGHRAQWQPTEEQVSTPTHVRIPIHRNQQHWATLELRFKPLPSVGLMDLLSTPLYQLVLIMGVVGFVVYLIYMTRTLRYLDPGSVVPGRVRAALDQLVEGAFILDQDQQIVLVNEAFAAKVGKRPDALLGVDPSTLDWYTDAESTLAELPWKLASQTGERMTNVRLQLNSPKLGVRILTANVSPIVDGGGKPRGVLATFDDISETERINQHLVDTIGQLESAQRDLHTSNLELVRLATIDPLTGALNRRALFERLELNFQVAQADGVDVSVIMADIDHFKSINDDFGHSVGDAVIKSMSNCMAKFAGEHGAVGRYGGEEFCMVLVDADAEHASQIADQIRIAFAEESALADSPSGGRKITASFGVSTVKLGAENVADLVNQADEALYESKHGGRDQVSIWTSPRVLSQEAG